MLIYHRVSKYRIFENDQRISDDWKEKKVNHFHCKVKFWFANFDFEWYHTVIIKECLLFNENMELKDKLKGKYNIKHSFHALDNVSPNFE